MPVVEDLSEEEKYLLAILLDPSGIDQAEFLWKDETSKDSVFRCYDFQYPWYRTHDKFQIDQCARSVGKSLGIQMRAFAFPFHSPGEEMLLTAPEMIHLSPITDKVADRILDTRISREMLKKKGTSIGITHRPFEARFVNGSRIMGRIPQKDGKGVKGCMVRGTMVLTRRGQVPIEQVAVGDQVLTHLGNWKPVVDTFRYVDADGFTVSGAGHRGLQMSESHRMLGRRNRNPQRTRNLERPEWVGAYDEELDERYYLGSPSAIPQEPLPDFPHVDHEAVLALAGAYVADGCLPRPTTISIMDDRDDTQRIAGLMGAVGLSVGAYPREGSRAVRVDGDGAARLVAFLREHFGEYANGKRLPVWLFGAEERFRKAFLNEYLAGDGYRDEVKRRWQAGTASKALAIDLRLLAQSLGYAAAYSWVDPKPNAMSASPQRSHRVTISESTRNVVAEDGVMWRKVVNVERATGLEVYDLNVQDDHSYLSDGLWSHNQHPKQLEMDEAQDYPEAGWVELGETLKYGNEDAIWRAHGVSRGVRDRFYKQTQEGSGWTVHRITAMHRGDWGPAERESKAELYGSRDHPDYRRNILGLHGDAQSALFVLTRLMACVDSVQSSDYNENEYHHVRITEEKLNDSGMPITALLQLPGRHQSYGVTWAGMDVGLTNHPSEILVFGEITRTKSSKYPNPEATLKLLSRIHLERISAPDQRKVMEAVFDHYRCRGFAMDRTGLGFPIYQEIMSDGGAAFQNSIRAYNFSEKIIAGYERDQEDDEVWWEDPDPEPIYALVLEYASDMLRLLVDTQRLVLPWDVELLREFQGQTYQISRSSTNPYGRKVFSQGRYHALDAARMAATAFFQEQLGTFDIHEKEPVLDSFLIA